MHKTAIFFQVMTSFEGIILTFPLPSAIFQKRSHRDVYRDEGIARSVACGRMRLLSGHSYEWSQRTVSSLPLARLYSFRFVLKPGEFLHDREGSSASSMSLSIWTTILCSGNVFTCFFTHAQILQRDVHKCSATFYQQPQCNRFADIPCYEDTRIRVRESPDGHDYIHASYLDGYRQPKKFIVTQAPLPQTMRQFWAMQWQEKTCLLVSMIQMYDVPPPQTSLRFIPTKTGEVFHAGPIAVEFAGCRRVRDTYDAVVLRVKKGAETRRLLCLVYFAWDDKGSPRRVTEVLQLVADMNHNQELLVEQARKDGWLKGDENSPISVNCLAGTGRSCTLVAIDIVCRRLDDTAKQPAGALCDVEDTVLRMRFQRARAVQKAEQFMLIMFCSLEYAIRKKYVKDNDWEEIHLEGYKYQKRDTKTGTQATENRE